MRFAQICELQKVGGVEEKIGREKEKEGKIKRKKGSQGDEKTKIPKSTPSRRGLFEFRQKPNVFDLQSGRSLPYHFYKGPDRKKEINDNRKEQE